MENMREYYENSDSYVNSSSDKINNLKKAHENR